MRVVTVIGNRPQFVKAAAVSRLLRAEHEEVLVHTGQHHDDELSRVFFEELGIPRPDHQLQMRGEANDIAQMRGGIEALLAEIRPDVVLIYGDTNSTVAGARAADGGYEVAHVEAGMRSFDLSMPEEVNRIETDRLSSLLLCSSQVAVDNIAREGLSGRVVLVGDVMVDIAQLLQPRARDDLGPLREAGVEPGEYLLVTAHRAGNVDDPERLERLVALLEALPGPVVLPLHPRTRARAEASGLLDRLSAAVTLLPPVGYLEFTSLLVHAKAVLTDSGGVQKEAYLAGVPCVTLRDTTEWVETVHAGWNVLVDLDTESALAALEHRPPDRRPELYGDGRAAERVVTAIGSGA